MIKPYLYFERKEKQAATLMKYGDVSCVCYTHYDVVTGEKLDDYTEVIDVVELIERRDTLKKEVEQIDILLKEIDSL